MPPERPSSALAPRRDVPSHSDQISVEEVLSQFKRGVAESVPDDDAATHYDLGIATDTFVALEAAIKRARDLKVDVLVTLGGASVGDHDLVQTALTREGMELGFWKIAMRPGKPLMHGRLGDMRILGLPGNPVSAIVCGVLFLVPLIRALSGDPKAGRDASEPAIQAFTAAAPSMACATAD